MTKNGDRHASIDSSDSWRSSDTVRAAFRSRPLVGVRTDSYLSENEPQISPGTMPPAPPPKDTQPRSRKPQPANWDASQANPLRDYRKQLAVLETSGARIPSISRNPPTATSPAQSGSYFPPTANGSAMPASWFNDSNDDLAELSPAYRRGSGQEDSIVSYPGDHRRPSVVSTVSSTGSKSSRGGYHKPLQNFFGEEFPGDLRQNSEPSLIAPYGVDPQFAARGARNRTNSLNNNVNASSRPVSPNMSRPRTPLPSSDVTPWEYQDRRPKDAPPSREERPSTDRSSGKSGKSHKLRLPGHRHHNSKDDKPAETNFARPEISHPIPLRPLTSREDSAYSLRRDQYPGSVSSAVTSRTNLNYARPPSPTPSAISELSKDTGAQRSPSTTKHRNLTQRFFGKLKSVPTSESLPHLPGSSISLQPSLRSAIKHPRQEPPPSAKKGGMDPYYRDKGLTSSSKDGKKEHKLPFKNSKRHQLNDSSRGKTSQDVYPDNVPHESLWTLDTDLNHMEGILHQPPMTPPIGDVITAQGPADPDKIMETKEPEGFTWDAPDSWAVKRFGDEIRHGDFDESAITPGDEDDTRTYCVRIFRTDSTFATLNLPLNTTALDIINIMGKKTMLQDDLSNYHIVMRKHDTSRQLEPHERPVLIQKRLLEQAGYADADRLEDIGREDNSYLCRFTFIPAKMVGYASLEKDPGFSKMQKFSHIDLQGKNLITIPILLYQKATEIISLNLSRNLSLDVPKDFIQACTNLREIKYTSNEARRLPPSLGLASRLTMLDISNNQLESLEKAELHSLQSLQGLRLSNNRLTSLPEYFGRYRALRSLNLSSNSLTEFPDFLCEVRTLVDLDVSFNSISSLPKIGQLTCLERLWATNNKLSGSFPSSLSNLVNLKEIDVRFNFLDNVDVMAQLPNLESLMIGHNSISAFEGAFQKLRVLRMDHNPVTRFGISMPCPSLVSLNLASAKLAQLPEDLFLKISGLTSLVLDKNHFTSISSNIGKLYRLEHLSVARNSLDEIPAEIGRLFELRYLDVRENNLGRLPPEIWYARRLETLNVSSNVLDGFPKPSNAPPPSLNGDVSSLDGGLHSPATTPGLGPNPSYEEVGKLEDFQNRRPSQASSGYLSSSTPPGAAQRKGSMASFATASTSTARKPSVASRTTNDTTITPVSRKDSTLATRLNTTFAGSLRHIFLADNRLSDDVFDELALLPELRIVNLSHNLIIDIPSRTIRRWHSLTELYLSGNDLTSLPTEDLGDITSLKVLHINSNKFQVLPAELGKVSKLAVLDVASNSLKYNVANWPYDWNWNWNPNLKYLNLSGNKRLEIKPSQGFSGERGAAAREENKNLTEFTSLEKLRILGLMDVTMMVPSVPEQTEDRRIRTTGSTVGNMPYGIADSLGRNEHVSTLDLVIPRFRSVDDEQVLGLFDGQPLSSGGSRIAKYLYDNLKNRFVEELNRLRGPETPVDALRRTYLGLNKELATAATQFLDKSLTTPATGHRNLMPELTEDDLHSGSVATVMYIKEAELYVSNVGDAEALLIRSEGGHKILTQKHDPAERNERIRIREAGGFVSRNGKLNDVLEVSRAFGYVHMSPSVIASPYIQHITLGDTDEMILIASRELWEYLTPDFAVDVARSERTDLSRAAQKLRDLAIAFGATNKIMVILLGVSDLKNAKNKRRLDGRRPSASLGPSGSPDEFFSSRRIGKRGRNLPNDSKLARLDNEVDAPTGEVSLVFTDIKNSTLLWETYPIAMRSAIKMHNELMRRQLRIIGGYEVKTEGDAFMVAFPTVTSALLWCFTIQSQLLEVPWPQEILNSINGQEVIDQDGNVIFRGLSVRMGIHYGRPVCEVDPVTKRMDYFGPMVNRASRISSVADGGQITVSADFIAEIQRLLETHEEGDRSNSAGSEEGLGDSIMTQAIQQELRSLSSQGFEVKDLGERRLKGLENPEYIYLMYPHSLASRLSVQRQMETKPLLPPGEPGSETNRSELTIDADNVWDLWNVSLRLEMLCSTLENPDAVELKPPETALLERMKTRSGELTDRFLLNFVEHQISRIETCTTTLALRHMVRPIGEQAGPMEAILNELQTQLRELRELKSAGAGSDTGASAGAGAGADSVQETPFVTPFVTPRATPAATPA